MWEWLGNRLGASSRTTVGDGFALSITSPDDLTLLTAQIMSIDDLNLSHSPTMHSSLSETAGDNVLHAMQSPFCMWLAICDLEAASGVSSDLLNWPLTFECKFGQCLDWNTHYNARSLVMSSLSVARLDRSINISGQPMTC